MRGAEPGDVLKVEILAVETDDFGSTAIFPGFGLLGDLFEEPYLVTWGLHDGSATSGRLEGIRIPADPFVGVIGVAPSHERLEQFRAREAALAEAGGVALPPEARGAVPAVEPYASTALRTIPPRETGGNLDVPQARAGATLFLPVDVAGRAALARRRALRAGRRRGLRHSHRGARPRHDSASTSCRRPGSATARRRRRSSRSSRPGRAGGGTSSRPGLPIRPDGSNADMDTTLAARNALLAMIDWLVAERGLTREQAYVLCSVAVDLRISEIVDIPNPVGVGALPARYLPGDPSRRGA